MQTLMRLAALLLAFTLTAAACGDDDDGSDVAADQPAEPTATSEPTSPPTPMPTTDPEPTATPTADEPAEELDDSTNMDGEGFPVTVESAFGAVTVESRPEAIVSLSATATETLFAIGAGPQVVATDQFSNYPPEAPTTDLDGFSPNIEAIVELGADLVIIQFDPGDVVASLGAVGIPVIIQGGAVSFDDAYAQMEQLGALTGHIGDAAELVSGMQSDIASLQETLADDSGVTYYHELDNLLYSVTSATFIGEVYSLAGLVNVADEADPDGEFFGYPQLSAEFLVETDPELIFLADTKCCDESAATVADRPGWSDLSAVQGGRIIELDDDIASRWGPRIVDFFAVITQARNGLVPS